MQATVQNTPTSQANPGVGKSRKTFVKVLNGVAQSKTGSEARAKAESLFQPIPKQVVEDEAYTVEQIAEQLNTSISYVYAMIAKMKPTPVALNGKAFAYGLDFVKSIGETPRRIRMRRVTPIAPVETAIVKEFANKLPPVSATALTQDEVKQAHAGDTKSLLERMKLAEAKTEEQENLLQQLAKRVREIEEMFGV